MTRYYIYITIVSARRYILRIRKYSSKCIFFVVLQIKQDHEFSYHRQKGI